ncbi:type VI secretion system baseplate subunit TssF [Algicella marina]|uniref:Type VI secretion system baseplate subunit TssF n=1 Tax=Algicella marina TaxID=2683284 RepID=A0A6P1T5I6_9RHOB|nr:type VI secretion system baseplate subunit TssF [Algicella marina]QHQ36549.1 type VI secretion system baseplate subunit TssF [Algicella marina]
MDTRLLKHYESELAFLREMGEEFAQSYPKIASRLGMDELEVLDPYVERLLEGVSFLSARVQLEIEQQFPEFTRNLLEIVYPHYLAPTPSMMIASFTPDYVGGGLAEGYLLPRETVLRSVIGEGQQTACQFRTSHDLTLWPLEVVEAEYIDGRGELVASGVAGNRPARAAIRLRLRRLDEGKISELPLDKLSIYLGEKGASGWQLHELLMSAHTGLVARSTDRRDDWVDHLTNSSLQPKGFEPEESLLPNPRQSLDGYRLLQEYFAMPERFHFVELAGLASGISRAEGAEVDIYILLRDGMDGIAPMVTPDAFDLHAVPAVNLFEKRCDRVPVTARQTEHQVVVDRTATLDYEVYDIQSVRGISNDGDEDVDFHPFYSSTDVTAAGNFQRAYFAQNRRMRQRTERERLSGARTTYLGSEVFLSLVDRNQAPYSPNLSQLAVKVRCTNRDLPLLLATGADNLFQLADGGPVTKVATPVSPTRPRPTLALADTAWRLISHLSLNYLSLVEEDGGVEALRELIAIYAPPGDRIVDKQLEGLVSVSTRPIVRRMYDEVLSTAVRGLEITLTFDEDNYEGSSTYLMAAVLERFFRKYATLNSFTETVLRTQQRGEIARWRPETGLGQMI